MSITRQIATSMALAAGLAAAAVPAAHAQTTATPHCVHQIERYNVLRGYASAKADNPAPGGAAPAPTHRQHH